MPNHYDNDNIIFDECQDVFTELKTKFQPKKEISLLLAQSYMRLNKLSRFERVENCGTILDYIRNLDDKFKLYRANFCKDRLCPMCSWRRSYKIFAQVSQIMNLLVDNYKYIFLTLTVPNCSSSSLSSKLDDMQKSWHRFIKLKLVKNAVCGFFKVLEITRNKKNGTYHPHYHVIIAVKPDYFSSADYINHNEWLDLWRKSMRDYSITQVDVRLARNKKTGGTSGQDLVTAVAEIAKYAVKSGDYIFKDNDKLTDSVVSVLSDALSYRRLTAFGGVFSDALKKLGLDDCEDGDLVHVDGELRSDVSEMIYRFGWSCGAYKLMRIQTPDYSIDAQTGEVIDFNDV